ncbi:DUF6896 domain-containing protein [Spirosoma jeollabukense]
MITKEKILLNIQAYKAAIDEVNTRFLQYCNGWNIGQLPIGGTLGPMDYKFHGIGCRAEKLGQVIDFDYNKDEYIEHVTTANVHLIVNRFDIYRFFNFVRSSSDQSDVNGLEAESLEPLFEELVAEGKLEKPDQWHFKFPTFSVV